MSRAESVDGMGRPAVRSLRDELASLRIERNGRSRPPKPSWEGGGGGGGGRLVGLLLWLIPLGLIGGAGAYLYPRLDAFRPKPEVSVGLVQAMTTGEAEKVLSAKGYL